MPGKSGGIKRMMDLGSMFSSDANLKISRASGQNLYDGTILSLPVKRKRCELLSQYLLAFCRVV